MGVRDAVNVSNLFSRKCVGSRVTFVGDASTTALVAVTELVFTSLKTTDSGAQRALPASWLHLSTSDLFRYVSVAAKSESAVAGDVEVGFPATTHGFGALYAGLEKQMLNLF
jgi:hypothetical protein